MPASQDSESDTEKLWRRNRALSILNAIAQALNREVDLPQALQTTLARSVDLLNLQTGWIWLLNEESGDFYLAAAQNLPPVLADHPYCMEGSCYCLDVYQAGDLKGPADTNIVVCSRLEDLVDGTDGLRYHASIPLHALDKELGVLNVVSADWRQFAADDLQLLYTIGDMLSIAVERARLFARSAQLGALEERNRLAREIHDTLAQGLSAITMQLETADALIDAGASLERASQAVRQALALARANLEEARRSVLDLRAIPLEGHTLAEALTDLIQESAQRSGLAFDFKIRGGLRPLPLRVEVDVYRIAQEAVTNVLRHAAARQVEVRLVLQPDQVRLTIADDGRGFDSARIPKDRFGLIGLNERARLLDGKLQLHSSPGAGTRLEVSVPLESP